MTEETTTVKGEIGKLVEWKTGKGHFLNLKGDKNDYYAWGKSKHKEGETVELTVKEGTGNFSDKMQITQIKALQPEKAQVQEKAMTAAQKMQEYCESADKTYYDRQDLIVKQCCIKAACELVGELKPRQEKEDWDNVCEKALYVADKLYFWVTDQEENQEEPQEVE